MTPTVVKERVPITIVIIQIKLSYSTEHDRENFRSTCISVIGTYVMCAHVRACAKAIQTS